MFYMFRCVKGILIIMYELVLPVSALISLILSAWYSLIVGILNLPFLCLYWVASVFTESAMAFVGVFQSVAATARQVSKVFAPVANEDTRETTMTVLQLLT